MSPTPTSVLIFLSWTFPYTEPTLTVESLAVMLLAETFVRISEFFAPETSIPVDTCELLASIVFACVLDSSFESFTSAPSLIFIPVLTFEKLEAFTFALVFEVILESLMLEFFALIPELILDSLMASKIPSVSTESVESLTVVLPSVFAAAGFSGREYDVRQTRHKMAEIVVMVFICAPL